jgi:hypothetical protein
MPYQVDRAGWRAAANDQIRLIGPEYRAIHGHFPIEKYDGAFPEARRIAWVRHPAAWVISLYHFWKHVETTTNPLVRLLHAGDLSIDEFARHPAARNQISGIFLKGSRPESFAFLGIQEHYETDCLDLARLMGWPDHGPQFENQNPEPGYDDRRRELYEDHRLIERLVALNEADMALYEEAVRLRDRRLEQAKARAERRARLVAIRHRSPMDRERPASEVA